MYNFFKKYNEKATVFLLFSFILIFSLLVSVAYKNTKKPSATDVKITMTNDELISIKEFMFSKLKSPFTNTNYKVKSGDTIQRILKKFEVNNKDINAVIGEFKKYGNNKLIAGIEIDLVIEKNPKIKK